MVSRVDRGGFSLVEALIAMTISTVLVLAIGSTFLAQSTMYARLTGGAQAQDQARTMVRAVQNLATSMVEGGLLAAESDRLVIRKPQTLLVVCDRAGSSGANTHASAGSASIDENNAAGAAKLNPSTGVWTYVDGSVRSFVSSFGNPAARGCFGDGVDTTGAYWDFVRLNNVTGKFGSSPQNGDVYMVYEDIELEIDTSGLPPATLGLFRGFEGETLGEYVSGLDATAGFEYRLNGSWRTTVTGSSLQQVDAIRVYAHTRVVAPSGGADDATFALDVVVPLR